MGLVSYQEDNQDAAGEPVKGKKTEDSIPEITELRGSGPRTEVLTMKNTVIVKADGLAINSVKIEGYSLDITFMDEEGQLEPQIDLTATARAESDSRKEVFLISTLYDIKEACSLLTALMLAIENQEAVFQVAEYTEQRK